MEPQLLILDETMAGLDHAMRAELLLLLDGLHARGITLLVTTHDIDFAYRWSDEIHLMNASRCVTSFLPSKLAKDKTIRSLMQASGIPMPGIIGLQKQMAQLGLIK